MIPELKASAVSSIVKPLSIVVLKGGWSAEREVSLTSGQAIAESLRKLGHDVVELDPSQDMLQLIKDLQIRPYDLIFNGLHGNWGEDGHFQAIAALLKTPMTHSNMLSSAISMDKSMTKRILSAYGLSVPNGEVVPAHKLQKYQPLSPPFVIKPVCEGSSVGVFIVHEGQAMPDLSAFGHTRMIIEEYIPGRELTTAVLGGKALTVTELKPAQGFYDYRAKYTAGATLHICPADLSPEVYQKCLYMAEAAHNALGCSGATRTDFRYDQNDEKDHEGRLVILEVNTQPGMTPLSLVPEQAKALGMSFDEFVQWMVDDALKESIKGAST